jgi:hypothetical protein
MQPPCAAKPRNYSKGTKYFTPDIKVIVTILYGHAKSVWHIFNIDLVVRIPGYRSRGPRFDSRQYQIF